MKKILLIVSLILINIGIVMSQTSYNPKLLSKFDKDYLDKQVLENPHFIERQNFIVENSYTIVDLSTIGNNININSLETFNHFTKTKTNKNIDNINLSEFNIFDFNTQPGQKEDNYYKIGNTGKVLIVFSVQTQTKLYNEYRNHN